MNIEIQSEPVERRTENSNWNMH